MTEPFKGLEPASVWHYFAQICAVPRPSKREDKMIAYLMDFATAQGLEVRRDKVGNVLMVKAATPGMEKLQTVVLQSHIDMVGEKNSDKQHDFYNDPIEPVIENGWVKASGTTLGADDGIGIAAQLALLASKDVPHGPLECLFTVDEETGLTGAFNLEEGFFEGKILLNLDSEDEGELFIGCAGGIDTLARFDMLLEPAPEGQVGIELKVSGLKGGHSGDDIHKGLGNANKILVRILWDLARRYHLRLSDIEGGNLRNAIAREARATGSMPVRFKEEVRVAFNLFVRDVEQELQHTDPQVQLSLDWADTPEMVYTKAFQFNLLNALYACPHGVIAMSHQIKELVETSTNLASVKKEGNGIVVTTSQRSSVESAKIDLANRVRSLFELAGADVEHSDGYPGWAPNMNSPLLDIAVNSYRRLFNQEPLVKAIHAGLECGLFLQKYPHLDMLSIGPTIKGAHSPDERLEIETVKKFWEHLLDILKNIGNGLGNGSV